MKPYFKKKKKYKQETYEEKSLFPPICQYQNTHLLSPLLQSHDPILIWRLSNWGKSLYCWFYGTLLEYQKLVAWLLAIL